ncbi:MAG: hypothetical protein JW774_07920 [Candidatus Aureabacteria bacterium]|nr:hypothetical protein [Candidatus Auribacterota bacterium]
MIDVPDPLKFDSQVKRPDLKVESVQSPEAIHPKDEVSDEQKRKKGHQHFFHEENKSHFDELSRAAEQAHHLLIKNKSPYRFCVYQEGEEIMIDIVRLDSNGAIRDTVRKNITHEDFFKWLEHIENGEGLIVDESV